MSRDDLMMQVESYSSLLRHPGFLLLQEEIRKLEASTLTDMQNAKDAEALLKHTHAFLMLGRVLKLPKLLRDTLASKLPKSQQTL